MGITNSYSAFQLAIIIPFYNEEKRIIPECFEQFANNNNQILLILVDDGSHDNTYNVLQKIQAHSPATIEIIMLEKNIGKGNAIRAGMIKAIETNIPFTAYMDADLSAPFNEIIKLYELTKNKNLEVVFGSRLKKIGSNIQRSFFRHLSGRTIATIVDTRFKIGCYDTQCSAKIFSTAVLPEVISTPFYTRWFFDIEIILRLKKNFPQLKIAEVPVDNWEHKPGSKITVFSFFTITKELIRLFNKY